MKSYIQKILIALLIIVFFKYCPDAYLDEPTQRRTEVIEVEGKAEIKSMGSDVWKPAAVGMEIIMGDLVRTSEVSYLDISIDKADIKNVLLRIEEKSSIKAILTQTEATIEISSGKVVFWAKGIGEDFNKFELRTPNTIVGIEGSYGIVEYNEQSDQTESWLDLGKGGYTANTRSGDFTRMPAGQNYIDSAKEKMKVEQNKKPKVPYSYDLRGFKGSYMFVGMKQAQRSGESGKYGSEYFPGEYRTNIGVSEGNVFLVPYDMNGPKSLEEIILNSGQEISVKGSILSVPIVDVESAETEEKIAPAPRPASPEKPGENKNKEKTEEDKSKDEDTDLTLDETLDEAQQPIP